MSKPKKLPELDLRSYKRFTLPYYLSDGGDGSASLQLTKTLVEAQKLDHSYDGDDTSLVFREGDEDEDEDNDPSEYSDGCNGFSESTADEIELYLKDNRLFRVTWIHTTEHFGNVLVELT